MRAMLVMIVVTLSACGTFHKPAFDGGGVGADAAVGGDADVDASSSAPEGCMPHESSAAVSDGECQTFLGAHASTASCVVYSEFLCDRFIALRETAPCCIRAPNQVWTTGVCLEPDAGSSFQMTGSCNSGQACTLGPGYAACDP